jgi:hypothetical protein
MGNHLYLQEIKYHMTIQTQVLLRMLSSLLGQSLLQVKLINFCQLLTTGCWEI